MVVLDLVPISTLSKLLSQDLQLPLTDMTDDQDVIENKQFRATHTNSSSDSGSQALRGNRCQLGISRAYPGRYATEIRSRDLRQERRQKLRDLSDVSKHSHFEGFKMVRVAPA